MTVLIAGVVAAVLSVVGTIGVSRLQRSGKIATSEAETLWVESSKMRESLRVEITRLEGRLENAEARIVTLISDHQRCEDLLLEVRKQLDERNKRDDMRIDRADDRIQRADDRIQRADDRADRNDRQPDGSDSE